MRIWNVEVLPRHPAVDDFIDGLRDPDRVNALRGIIHDVVPDATEGIKWGVPMFFRNGPLCYISPAKAHITFGVARGIEVDDAHGRLTSTGKSPIAKMIIKANEEMPLDAIRDYLGQAVNLDEIGD